MTLQEEMVYGLTEMEADLGDGAFFTFNKVDYPAVCSVNEFKRVLDTGGFTVDKLLTISVQLQDIKGNDVFDVLPVAQQIITYNGENFRIENTKKHPTNAVLRIMAVGTTRGI
jgi:hypothetical protein